MKRYVLATLLLAVATILPFTIGCDEKETGKVKGDGGKPKTPAEERREASLGFETSDDPDRDKSAKNLRQIFLAALMHANERKGKMPTSFGEFVSTQDIGTGMMFINPRKRSAATPPKLPADAEKKAEWVERYSDYVWIAVGPNWSDSPEKILAYENPEGLSGGINMLFADGKVKFIPIPEATARIAAQQQASKTAVEPHD